MRASCVPASTARCRSVPSPKSRSKRRCVRWCTSCACPANAKWGSLRVGEYVMVELRKLDHVGYVRFASVYRSFQDVADFREEIEKLERELPVGSEQLPLLEAALERAGKPGKR